MAHEARKIDRGDGVDDGGVAAEIERCGLDRRRLLGRARRRRRIRLGGRRAQQRLDQGLELRQRLVEVVGGGELRFAVMLQMEPADRRGTTSGCGAARP